VAGRFQPAAELLRQQLPAVADPGHADRPLRRTRQRTGVEPAGVGRRSVEFVHHETVHRHDRQLFARQFSAADPQNTGTLTEAQARAAGLGYVANHFRQIDASGSGRVSFSDVQRFMQTRSEGQQ
jgi:hypothetical protein